MSVLQNPKCQFYKIQNVSFTKIQNVSFTLTKLKEKDTKEKNEEKRLFFSQNEA